MILQTQEQVEHTRNKLSMIESMYEQATHDDSEGPVVRELTLESLKRIANQLREELARYGASQSES